MEVQLNGEHELEQSSSSPSSESSHTVYDVLHADADAESGGRKKEGLE